MTCRRLHLVKAVLQVTALWLAIGVCLSRISDYKHHWSDVMGGAAIGGIVAVLVVSHYVQCLRSVYCVLLIIILCWLKS